LQVLEDSDKFSSDPQGVRGIVDEKKCLRHLLEQLVDVKTQSCPVIRKLSLNRSGIFD
jgi:hypothetical protein